MPQEQVSVYSVEDGTLMRMHSVDAQEAVALGDYTFTMPHTKAAELLREKDALPLASHRMRRPA